MSKLKKQDYQHVIEVLEKILEQNNTSSLKSYCLSLLIPIKIKHSLKNDNGSI